MGLRTGGKACKASLEGALDMQEVVELLEQLEHSGFFGSLEIKFERGRIVLSRRTENLKLPDPNPRGTRGDNDGRNS